LFNGFPRVVAFWISPPFKKILQFLVSPEASVLPYCFHFVLILAFDKVGWWSREVGAVRVRFDIWGKKAGVKDRVNVPLDGEF